MPCRCETAMLLRDKRVKCGGRQRMRHDDTACLHPRCYITLCISCTPHGMLAAGKSSHHLLLLPPTW